MTDEELYFTINAIREIVTNVKQWENDYEYDIHTNEFFHKSGFNGTLDMIKDWFDLSQPVHR
jgi:hypothetical protein